MIELRSYRRVFDLERRIYSVDRLRLNPAGIPVRGAMYFFALLLVGVAMSAFPLVGRLVVTVPWYLRDVAVPAGAATVLAAIRVEGRTFHLAAQALIGSWLSRRVEDMRAGVGPGQRWYPTELLLLPDGSDCRLRRLRYVGPGAVRVSVEHERVGRAAERERRGVARPGLRCVVTLRARPQARPLARAQVVSLRSGARLLVTPSAARE